jgi:hypothetical protein
VFCACNSVLVKKSTKIFQNKCGQVVLYKLYILKLNYFFFTLTDSGSATESPTNPGGTEAPTDPGTEAPTGPVGECQILPHYGNTGCGDFKDGVQN